MEMESKIGAKGMTREEVIEACEKQLPKRLLVEEVESTKIYYCPYCTEKLMEIGRTHARAQVLIPGTPPYCYNCGQRLDWGEDWEDAKSYL